MPYRPHQPVHSDGSTTKFPKSGPTASTTTVTAASAGPHPTPPPPGTAPQEDSSIGTRNPTILASAAGAVKAASSECPDKSGPLKEIGFWADPRDPEDTRPDPAQLVDEEWGKTVAARAVALYSRSGFLESFELGYSFCRLGCGGGIRNGCGDGGEDGGGGGGGGGGRKIAGDSGKAGGRREVASKFMGCCTLTDGKYAWPEGLAHYVSEHAVRPPADFVATALKNLRVLRQVQSAGRLRWDVGESGEGKTAPLEPGTAVFIRDNTTLGIALPPEPEKRTRGSATASTPGVCSCTPS